MVKGLDKVVEMRMEEGFEKGTDRRRMEEGLEEEIML